MNFFYTCLQLSAILIYKIKREKESEKKREGRDRGEEKEGEWRRKERKEGEKDKKTFFTVSGFYRSLMSRKLKRKYED